MSAESAKGFESRLNAGISGRQVRTGKTRNVLLAVFGLLLVVCSPLVVAASPASATSAMLTTTTVIGVNPAVATWDSSVVFSAVISPGFPAPAKGDVVTPGQVTFTDGLTSICVAAVDYFGTASCSFPTGDLPLGTQTIVGSYSGGNYVDETFSESGVWSPSSGEATLTVVGSTVTTPVVSPTTTTFGSSVTYSATVTGPDGAPTGTVNFTYGLIPLCTATLAPTLIGDFGSCSASNAPGGTDTITATYVGDTHYLESSGTAPLVVNKANQAPLMVASTSGVAGTPLALTFSGGSGTGAVSNAVADGTASGCLIVLDGTLNVTGAGTCIVTATKAGDGNYNAISSAPTTVTFSYANQAPLTLTSTNGVSGTPLPLTFSGGSGTGVVSYAVTDGTASGCLIDLDGTLNATSAGTCIVVVTKAGDATYNAVTSPLTTVTFSIANQAPLTLTSTVGLSGQPLTLTTSGGSGGGAVSYAVTDGTAVGCLISGDTLSTTSTGTCIVTATKAGDAIYNVVSSAPTTVTFLTTSSSTSHGYWLVGSDGGIFTFGSAQFYGSTGNLRLQRPVVGITPTAGDLGYWLVASDGGIFSFGNAGFYGSIPGLGIAPAGSGGHSLNAPIVGMVPSSDGGGYFMVGADGGVFTFGDAKFEGSCPAIGGCAGGAAVAVMPDATGNGYWVVTAGGDVQPFGDAAAYGGPGPVGGPVVAAVRTPDGGGYYVLFGGGEVFAYGDAVYRGGAYGEVGGSNPASTIFTTADNGGYWIVSANGSVITEGDALYEGGANNLHLNGAIIAGTGW